jgi:kinetochore protein NNF1
VKRNVTSSLNAFDHLIADAVSRKRAAEVQAAGGNVEIPTPPHVLSPDALLAAKLGPWLGDQQGVLGGTLQGLEEENEKLGNRVIEQRREMEQLVNNLEMLVKDLEKSAEMVGGVEGIRGVALAQDMEE